MEIIVEMEAPEKTRRKLTHSAKLFTKFEKSQKYIYIYIDLRILA